MHYGNKHIHFRLILIAIVYNQLHNNTYGVCLYWTYGEEGVKQFHISPD